MMDNLLDEKIAKFYETTFEGEFSENVQKYFFNDNLYNWTQIEVLLCDDFSVNGNEDFKHLNYAAYLRIVNKLKPIYIESLNVSKKLSVDSTNFHFLGSWKCAVMQLTDVELNASETQIVESVLTLTAALEFALGNVYFTLTQGKQPPHLLKDLLNAAELQGFFGKGAIWFLKVLLGTPNAINLRNIVWHGFPKPMEIPQYFVSVLLIAVYTIGYKIQSQQQIHLLQRPQVADLSRYLTKLEKYMESQYLLQNTTDALVNCTWISSEHKKYWQQLFKYFNSKMWWQFVILAMPQIELLLRLIYAQVNSYDVRAKLDEYYITMDTIFESNIPTDSGVCPNALLTPKTVAHLSEGCLKFMYDLFVASQGPRIRDKVSHGEITLDCINNPMLCSLLLQLSLSLLKFNSQTCAMAKYETHFHLNSIAGQCINSAKMFLISLTALPLTTKFKFSAADEEYLKKPLSLKIEIFQRHNKEAEIMNLILKISQSASLTCENYKQSVTVRLQLLQQRELHSKRRKTLENMLTSLPVVWKTLCSIINSAEILYVMLQQNDTALIFESPERFARTIRFLKHTLKYSENFVKYSAKENNEWIKALELCNKFQETRACYFEQRYL